MARLLLSALILALAAATAQAQIYRWVDANGKTHYSDAPPATGKPKVDMVGAGSAPAGTKSGSDWQEKEREFRRRRAEINEATAKEEQEAAARREKACSRARSQMAAMEGVPVYRVGKNGERIYLDDGERTAYEERTRREMTENCPR